MSTDNKYDNAPSTKVGTTFKAIDTLATEGPRTHDLRNDDGSFTSVTFPNKTIAVPVSFTQAMRLVTIPGFIVLDNSGKEFRPAKRGNDTVILAADETVARYTELTQGALKTRCEAQNIILAGKPNKEDYISALVSSGGSQLGQAKPPGEETTLTDADDLLIDESDEEAA